MSNQARRRKERSAKQADSQTQSGSWFLILLGLPFLAVGIGMLALAVLPTLYDWARMQSWQELPARVVSAQLITHRGGKSGNTYSVSAHYRYEVAGVTYDGFRPAINTSADNIGSFHANVASRLEHAQRSGTPAPVWVNPSQPQDAVADRSLRLDLLGFRMIFVVVFGAIGAALLAWGLHLRRSPAQRAARLQAVGEAPWLANKAWADNRIRSGKRWEVWLAWGFAVVWGGIAYPAAMAALPRAWNNANYLVVGVLGTLVAVGLGLLVWAVRATRDAHRHGEVHLVMDPFPGSIGGHVGAAIDLPAIAYRPDLQFEVTLRCAYHYQTRSAGDDSTESREQLVWQTEGVAQVQPQGAGSRLSFRLNVPEGLPQSEDPVGDSVHHWTVLLKSSDPGLTFSRRFEVPVYATRTESHRLTQDAASHPQMQVQRDADLSAASDIERVAGGVRLYQPYARLWRHQLMWLGIGGVFFGFGLAAKAMHAPALFMVFFGGAGSAMLLWGFFALCNSLRVQLDGQGLRTERRLLGLMFAWHQVPRSDLRGLQLVQSYTSQTGAEQTVWYRIRVVLKSGKTIAVADSLGGKAVADQMLQTLSDATGLPTQSA